jgi:AcrR family transcriptional regulator
MRTPESSHDRRARRTRASLRQAFVHLVLERGLDSVTVGGVAARARVGRSTLYLHYRGIRGLLEATLDRPCSALAAATQPGFDPARLLPQLEHFREQAGRNAAYFREPIRRIWATQLARHIRDGRTRGRARSLGAATLPEDLRCLALAEAMLALVARWVQRPRAASAAALSRALVALGDALG